MFNKSVTIIGAGPSGLTLARLLQMRGVTVRLFEHDASFSSRDQGGTFDIHSDGGQKALIEAKLFDEFKKFARPEGQALKIIDKHGNGQHKLVFKDGTSETTDFLVGADGTWSKVRPLLSSIQAMYTGVTFIETRISNSKVMSPQINELVGQGSAYALGDNKALLAQRNGDESIRVYIALRAPEDCIKRFDTQPLAIRATLLEMFSGWQSELLDMLRSSDDYYVPRTIYSVPLEEYWTTKSGLTIIGDAAHVMTPFAGQGANLAMLDALELADCLTSIDCTNLTSVTEAVKTFEEAMINRARIFSKESLDNLNAFIAEDAPRQVVEIFQGFQLKLKELGLK